MKHTDESKLKISETLMRSDIFRVSIKNRDTSNIGAKVGHKHSEETKSKLSRASCKQVMVDNIEYQSVTIAGKENKVHANTIRRWIKLGRGHYIGQE